MKHATWDCQWMKRDLAKPWFHIRTAKRVRLLRWVSPTQTNAFTRGSCHSELNFGKQRWMEGRKPRVFWDTRNSEPKTPSNRWRSKLADGKFWHRWSHFRIYEYCSKLLRNKAAQTTVSLTMLWSNNRRSSIGRRSWDSVSVQRRESPEFSPPTLYSATASTTVGRTWTIFACGDFTCARWDALDWLQTIRAAFSIYSRKNTK